MKFEILVLSFHIKPINTNQYDSTRCDYKNDVDQKRCDDLERLTVRRRTTQLELQRLRTNPREPERFD